MLKKIMKNERGLTLIELLAVVVILGIIAAIAIPAIGGMIANSKADAHIANAKQIANAARLYVTTGDIVNKDKETDNKVTLKELIDAGHLESIKDPNGNADYDTTKSFVIVDDPESPTNYYVTLEGASKYADATDNIDASDLTREDIDNYK
ncbi:prepilin-type N-terminal cleavage/methylation domain-containing protein [Metabacillus schmidteae]|uniref:prepilin-type N-terminal cleavage/methylation domain-containing protein n=1 Tax=Metabacillus schmidteae TaxID=2730405 RepID=UPI00158ECE37|nr:prepilin-type N-terminal cleavage/methylation domain-containing protein [Metabacillus schmidteae]